MRTILCVLLRAGALLICLISYGALRLLQIICFPKLHAVLFLEPLIAISSARPLRLTQTMLDGISGSLHAISFTLLTVAFLALFWWLFLLFLWDKDGVVGQQIVLYAFKSLKIATGDPADRVTVVEV